MGCTRISEGDKWSVCRGGIRLRRRIKKRDMIIHSSYRRDTVIWYAIVVYRTVLEGSPNSVSYFAYILISVSLYIYTQSEILLKILKDSRSSSCTTISIISVRISSLITSSSTVTARLLLPPLYNPPLSFQECPPFP